MERGRERGELFKRGLGQGWPGVDSVRDGVFLVYSGGATDSVLRRWVFQFLDKVVFRPGLRNDRFVVSWVQHIDKVVDVQVVMQRGSLQGASMKAFGTFSRCSHLQILEFYELLVSGSHLPVCVATAFR